MLKNCLDLHNNVSARVQDSPRSAAGWRRAIHDLATINGAADPLYRRNCSGATWSQSALMEEPDVTYAGGFPEDYSDVFGAPAAALPAF